MLARLLSTRPPCASVRVGLVGALRSCGSMRTLRALPHPTPLSPRPRHLTSRAADDETHQHSNQHSPESDQCSGRGLGARPGASRPWLPRRRRRRIRSRSITRRRHVQLFPRPRLRWPHRPYCRWRTPDRARCGGGGAVLRPRGRVRPRSSHAQPLPLP